MLSDVYKEKNGNRKLNLKKQIEYWRDTLFEKLLNIFKWDGLPATIPQHELEQSLIIQGFTAVVGHDKGLWAVMGSMSGVTPYNDIFKKYTYANPIFMGSKTISRLGIKGECVVISNNYSKLPTIRLIERYAILLAHSDLMIQSALINFRSMGILGVTNDAQAASVKKWYDKLVDGDTVAVVDGETFDAPLNAQGLRSVPTPNASASINDIIRVHDSILREFYNDIGLPMSRDKREREIESETTQDNYRMLFNVKDMLNLRKQGCEAVNAQWGTKWSVDLTDEYKMVIGKTGGLDGDDTAISV